MFKRLAQSREIVERDSGKHVMFHVVLHVPVEKGRHRTAGIRPAAKAKIGDVGREADMLRNCAEKLQPGAVLAAKGDDDDQEPMTSGDEKSGQDQVTNQDDSGPVPVVAAQLRLGLGQNSFHPVRGEKQGFAAIPKRGVAPGANQFEGNEGIDGERRQDELDTVPVQTLGQHDFAVVLGMHRDLVMFHVAEPVAHWIEPREESVDRQEKIVPELCLEWGLVAKLMSRDAAEEVREGSMDKQREQQQRHRPKPISGVDVLEGQVGERPSDDKEQQLGNDLGEGPGVALPHELAHDCFFDLRPVPIDLDDFAHDRAFINGILIDVQDLAHARYFK